MFDGVDGSDKVGAHSRLLSIRINSLCNIVNCNSFIFTLRKGEIELGELFGDLVGFVEEDWDLLLIFRLFRRRVHYHIYWTLAKIDH